MLFNQHSIFLQATLHTEIYENGNELTEDRISRNMASGKPDRQKKG